jgi:hypothetical protein
MVLMLAGCASARPSSGKESCADLYTRLQRVTATISSTSELLTNSLGSQQLSDRVAFEEEQLRQSAQLMASAAVPDKLAAANRQLVAALQAMTADFARAEEPAARGDFQAASEAMTDHTAVQQIVDASTRIEAACGR